MLVRYVSDSWWIDSRIICFLRKEEFGAYMIEKLGSSYVYRQWHFDYNPMPRECVLVVGKRKVRRGLVDFIFLPEKNDEVT